MRGLLRVLFCAAIAPCLFSAPLHAKPHIVAFSLGFKTYPTGINNSGAIAGYIVDSAQRGFVRQPDGTVVFFDITEPYARNLITTGINDLGDVTGYYGTYVNNTPVARGFVRKADGTITTFGLPNGGNSVNARLINSSGTVFGNYWRGKTIWYGFTRQPDGTTTKLTCLSAPFYLTGANDSGQVSGSNNAGGLVLNPDGSCTQFDAGYPSAINAEGSVVGLIGSHPYAMNFLRTPDGAMTTYTIPTQYVEARPVGINASRVIAGYVTDDLYKYRGYVRGANGHVTVFDAGDGILGGAAAKATMPAAINDTGVIVGLFYGPENGSEPAGFIRYP